MKWFIIILSISSVAQAEFFENDFASDQPYILNDQNTSGYQYNASNGISEAVLDAQLKKDQLEENYNNLRNGRKYKAADSEKTANIGGAIAIATGSALIAIGTPKLSSIFLSERIAGADLVAKGGMEIAQGAADLANASTNGSQKELLQRPDSLFAFDELSENSSSSRRGFSSGDMAKIQSAVNNPAFQNLLADRGINPDHFTNQLLNGEIMSPSDVFSAVGDFTEFSAEDLAAGKIIAADALGQVQEAQAELTFDELNPTFAGLHGGPKSGEISSADGIHEALKAAAEVAGVNGASETATVVQASAGFDAKALLNRFITNRKPASNLSGLFSEAELQQAGIKAKPTENIFGKARQTFSSFRKWRGN